MNPELEALFDKYQAFTATTAVYPETTMRQRNPQEHDYYDVFNGWLEVVSDKDLHAYQRDLNTYYNSWQMVWERKAVRLEIERRTAEQEEKDNMKFRKKPVVIEAFQMTRERRMDNSEWPTWLHKAWNKNEGETGALFRQNMDAPLPDLLCIWTLEGVHLVDWGDWIIQGVKGELYPCKPDIFEATYEPA